MQRVYEKNEWGKVSKRIVTIPLSILQGSQTWCTMGVIKTFTCCILLFFISGSLTPNYTLLALLAIKLLFLSAVNNVVTILFSMGRVTLMPNSPLNGWEKDGRMEIGLLKDWRVVDGVQFWCQSVVCGCRCLTWQDKMEFVWRTKQT